MAAKANSYAKRILLLGNSYLVIFNFRKELIEHLVSSGFEVWVSFPNGPLGEGVKGAEQFNCHFIETHMERRGTNPIKDLFILFEYIRLIRTIKPDLVLTYTVKPDIYGGIACRVLGIPYMPNITGLGKGLSEGRVTRAITIALYKLSVQKAKHLFFQNLQDKKFFDEHGIRYQEGIVLPGSGVNLNEFTPLEYPDDKKIIFTYVGRVMKAKGIEQFLDAAERLGRKYRSVEFHICGFCEENYLERIQRLQDACTVIYHGLVKNILEYEKISHCIVLPSFHPEGISNVLLEGAACARPLITTDRPGCRETVDDGVTGYLVKERNVDDLVEKMEKFIGLSIQEKKSMGLAGREKIAAMFGRDRVVKEYADRIQAIASV